MKRTTNVLAGILILTSAWGVNARIPAKGEYLSPSFLIADKAGANLYVAETASARVDVINCLLYTSPSPRD